MKEASENLMRRYLLGALPEAEVIALEQTYFADSETFERVWAVENELVDGYVRGRLSRQERDLFERHYLESPKHRQRVAIAKELLQHADALLVEEKSEAAVTPPARASWWSNFLENWRGPQFVWGGALALATLLLVLGGWWSFKNISTPDQTAKNNPPAQPPATVSEIPLNAPPATPPPTPALAASPKESLPPHLAKPPAASPILGFALLGAGLRGATNIQQLTIPKETKQVRLQIKLEENEYAQYLLTLRSVDGRSRLTRSIPRPAQPALAVLVPTTQLPAGDYLLTLSGTTQTQEADDFRVFFPREPEIAALFYN